jgi:hypothetical protein
METGLVFLPQFRHRPVEIKNLEVNDMTQYSKIRVAALSVSFATMATLAFFAQTGSAQAVTSLSQCSGPSRENVVDCCSKFVSKHPQFWMIRNNISCNKAVNCRGAKKSLTAVALVKKCSVMRPIHDFDFEKRESREKRTSSDIRLKTDIHRIGTTVLGLPLYQFQYRNRVGVYLGVMAQDVLKVEPSAVSMGSDGYYMVDYGKLGIAMERIQ